MAVELSPDVISTVVQVIATSGMSIMGIRGMIAALTSRVEALEVDVSALHAKYTRDHPVSAVDGAQHSAR